MSENNNELQREFEMERVILFSDAVFAIAITLLIIEIKFPETPEKLAEANYWKLFMPTLIQFGAFIISFFFIGNFWAKHLRLCRQMKQYDQGLIARNLIFLFFIVTFPFTAKGLAEHIRPGYLVPLFVYVCNIACCTVAHTVLCYYVFYSKPQLSYADNEVEKKYIYLKSKYFSVLLVAEVTLIFVINWFFPNNLFYIAAALYLIPVASLITRKRLSKLKQAALP